MSFFASSDSGRRRIVCKERFPPTDCATVGRCSASPRSAPRWPLGPLGHNWWWWCTIDGVEVWKDQIIIIIVMLLIFVTAWPIVFFFQMFSFMQWWSMQKEKLFGYLPWEAYCIRRNLLRTMSCHLLPNLCWLRLWHLWCTRDITGHYIRLQLSSQYQTFMVKTKTWRGSCLFCTVAPQRQETWQRDSPYVL